MSDPGFRGARLNDGSFEVAVTAPAALRIDVCLPLPDGSERRLTLPERFGDTWWGRFSAAEHGIGPGQTYGLRAEGPWDPAAGACFDYDRLLLDPYARAVTDAEGHPLGVLLVDEPPPAPLAARRPLTDTVIYEAHVRGLTRRHPGVPEHLRGTYAGLATPAVLDHLLGLGVTAVELLPVHQFRTEPVLRRRGIRNYWGYSTLSWFAPHGAYSASGDAGGQVAEFRAMVGALHDAGLEVLIDVVYNHTCEGGRDEPALSWRGLDDGATYRRNVHGDYVDVTGCGNTVRTDHPATLRLLLDSLRYWMQEMGVDGFRFDLAPALARTDRGIDTFAAPLAAMAADPVLQQARLIAEPWDLGTDGYLVGRFPAGWSEWNDRFRDTVRDVWRGRSTGVRGLASALCGSSELYASTYRGPHASVNYVTSHDDYTLRDLVSYEHRRNHANGEGNRDGHSDSHSWNTGVEGETDDPTVVALRQRRAASMLTTLLLSAGVPMLLAGDELGRTQRGNNNAYCIDDETTWVDWESFPGVDPARHGDWQQLTPLVAHLLALRHAHPVLRPDRFPSGRTVSWRGKPEQPVLTWFGADGRPMTEEQWSDSSLTGLAMCRADTDDAFLLLVHANGQDERWRLPWAVPVAGYKPVLDTGAPGWGLGLDDSYEPGATLTLRAWSAVLLRCRPG